MSRLQKLRTLNSLKWVPLLCPESNSTSSKSNLYLSGSHHLLQHLRFCGTESLKNGGNLGELAKKSRVVKREAQAALLEYFHFTRSFQIMDAENMSKNTPDFFDRLLRRVDIRGGGGGGGGGAEVGKSVSRFLRYNPVNEFEPFFESIGLSPSEYSSFLPRNLMFLNDDHLLLENYYVLCNYGVARNRIGKIYKEARAVFGYDYGVLKSKLQSFQDLGLKQSLVAKVIASSPRLLWGDVDKEFVIVLEKFKKIGITYDWLEEHISIEDSYDWKCMLELVFLLSDLGLSDEQLGELFAQHPPLLLESSGRVTFCLFGLLLKFGSKISDVQTVFLQFPPISVLKFTENLCNCYNFLVEINMPVEEIGKIVGSHSSLLGSCELKSVKSLMSALNCGKNRLCQMVKEDPRLLKKWALGKRVDPLQEQKRVLKVRMMKTEFFSSLGFEEKTNDFEKALKICRGKGVELQERFDCLVNIGFSCEEVVEMLKASPQILNQSSDVIEKKVGFFVRDLGYTLSDLRVHPKIISYTIPRLKLRLLMYKWLKEEGAVHPKLALSTLLSSSDDKFVTRYVNSHTEGPEFWERLKKEINSDENI
ncbi:hypothetical protein ABFS83_10G173300 [Erythranthe nasuta]